MRLRRTLVAAVAAVSLAAAPVPALVGMAAAVDCGNSPAAKEVLSNLASSEVGSDCGQSRVNNIFQTVVNILSIIVGVASVIVVIYAGLKYITSGGESGRVANAKGTLLYALVGLAVAALAQFLIHFVLFQANQAGNPPPAKKGSSYIRVKPPDMA
ncbi:MAG TPA: pilin [Candidatus Saccharimonadales bacterium]|nr:pilin [Candidatus Saccharimonadales bacterium]